MRYLLAILFIFFLPLPSYSQIPDYKNWNKCFGESVKTCFDNKPILTNNFITLYFDKLTNKESLLIWYQYKRSNKKFTVHGSDKSYQIDKVTIRFYKLRQDEWLLLETKEILRNKSTKNRGIPIFEQDSPFGKEYIKHKNLNNPSEKKRSKSLPLNSQPTNSRFLVS